jgi:acetyl-CoA acetyltransferase
MFRHLGSTGLAVTQVESASASGCSAFRQACLEVASGVSDVVVAIGVDKFGDGRKAADKDGLPHLAPTATMPPVKFALMAHEYLRQHGLKPEAMARVAVKNHGNAALNPYAQFRKARTLEQVMASPKVVGDLTVQQCCPRGDGAAAVIVVSEAAIKRLGLDKRRAVRVLASVANSEELEHGDSSAAVDMVRKSTAMAYEQAGVGPRDLNLVELHEAFRSRNWSTPKRWTCARPEKARHGSNAALPPLAANARSMLRVACSAWATRPARPASGRSPKSRARYAARHMDGSTPAHAWGSPT